MSKYNPYKLILTQHAKERAWERARMDASRSLYCANKSLDEGHSVAHDPTLRPYIEYAIKKYNPSGMYLFEGNVYIFQENTLVTFYSVRSLADYS